MTTARQGLDKLLNAAQDGRLDLLCDRFGIDLLSVFGSVLDQSVSEPADLDLAVRFGAGVVTHPIEVIAALYELSGVDVDLMIINRAGVVARSRALGPGSRGLYERKRGGYALAQMAAMSEEMETAPMRRRDLDLLGGR